MTTAPSPEIAAGALATFTVKVDGQAIPDSLQVVSIDTWSRAGKVPKARLVISDGNPAQADFEVSNLDLFLPGGKVDVALGYDGRETSVFRGVIVKQGLEITPSRASRLVVDVTDEALKMTLERKNGVFEKIKDSDLIGKLISANGLKKKVTATKPVQEDVVQYYATDWDLMLMRAEVNGFVVLVEDGTVTVAPPDTSQKPVLSVVYGSSMLDLDAEMNAATQLDASAIHSASWDVGTQKVAESGPGRVSVKEPGNVSSAQLAKVFKVKKFLQQTGASVEKTALQDWSSAELLKSKLSKIQGSVRFQGSSQVKPGKTLELGGLGRRFNGSVWVGGVHHRVSEGQWLTTAAFGLSARWFAAEAPDVVAPEASGQLPAIQGLQTGVVKKVAKDPGGEFRVQVSLPLLQSSKSVWARLATFYASKKAGAVFYPETGDEVIVAFMNQDPRDPVILGSVFSKKRTPPVTPDDKNTKKALVTRGKLELTFDDQDKILEIRTPKHTIKMDDKSGAVSIRDGNRNQISLSKGGITLDSASNLKIKAKQNVTIQAGANLKLSAKLNVAMDGLQVSHKAKTKFAAQGSAAAELKAGGILTVRGALVKIN